MGEVRPGETGPKCRPSDGVIQVRWVVLVAFLAYGGIAVGEGIVWKVLGEGGRTKMETAVSMIQDPRISDQHKEIVRNDALAKIVTGPIIAVGIAIVLFLVALCVGVTMVTRTPWNSTVGIVCGTMVSLVMAGALSVTGLIFCLISGMCSWLVSWLTRRAVCARIDEGGSATGP